MILDYKTGSIPTKLEVERGLSAQLIIEAMMLEEDGFGIGKWQVDEVVYVKIASNRPHFECTKIKLTKNDILRHKDGLIKLLNYYALTGFFSAEFDLLKYNDYKHLARI